MQIPPDQSLVPDPARPAIVVGLISGTSADGVDAACCRLSHPADDELAWEVLGVAERAYPEAVAARLADPAAIGVPELGGVSVEVARVFADAAADAVRDAGLTMTDITLIGSHGQTVWHDPRADTGTAPSTLQVGEPAEIAERTGCVVWSDFRAADIAAGGEGAPFVPFIDRLLLADPDRWRVCLNIGGIANVTYLDPENPSAVVGFDTGPGNALIDLLARRLLDRPFDDGGAVAATGVVDASRVAAALSDPYFDRPAPRSTGREYFDAAFLERHFAPLDGLAEADVCDRLASVVALTARSIAEALEGRAGTPPVPGSAEVLVSGGGRRNATLMTALAEACAPRRVRPVDDVGLDGDLKEAIAFAVLAYESALGRPVHVPAVTGATHPVRVGRVSFPPVAE